MVMAQHVLVTGGTGTLGRRIVARLRDSGRDVRVLTRHSRAASDGVEYVTGDLLTGEGIGAAVEGVTTILHCAGSATGDVTMTTNLVRAVASRGGTPHLVFISVAGADRVPVSGIDSRLFGYFKSKRDTELLVAESGLPWTTLRATQFYDLILMVARQMAKLPVIPAPAGFQFQPVDSDEVAARMVELALGEPAGLVPELGGPTVYEFRDLIRSYLRSAERRRPVLPVPLPTHAGRAIREGAILADSPARGRRTWEEFLRDQTRETMPASAEPAGNPRSRSS